jgi:hypothetical protein
MSSTGRLLLIPFSPGFPVKYYLQGVESNSRSTTQEFANIFKNLKVHCRVHRKPPLATILRHINAVHTISSYFSKSHLILSSRLHLYLPSSLFHSGFHAKILHTFLFYSCVLHAYLSDISLLEHSNYTWAKVGAKGVVCGLVYAHLADGCVQTKHRKCHVSYQVLCMHVHAMVPGQRVRG